MLLSQTASGSAGEILSKLGLDSEFEKNRNDDLPKEAEVSGKQIPL